MYTFTFISHHPGVTFPGKNSQFSDSQCPAATKFLISRELRECGLWIATSSVRKCKSWQYLQHYPSPAHLLCVKRGINERKNFWVLLKVVGANRKNKTNFGFGKWAGKKSGEKPGGMCNPTKPKS